MKMPILELVWRLSGRKALMIEADRCVRCGKCAKNCPRGAITKTPENAYIIAAQRCIRCGRCRETCPRQAIRYKEGE